MAQERQTEREVDKQLKGLSEYQTIQNKFTQNLRRDLHRYILCQTCTQRGTKDLNRDYVAPSAPDQLGEGRNPPLDVLKKLRENIHQYYPSAMRSPKGYSLFSSQIDALRECLSMLLLVKSVLHTLMDHSLHVIEKLYRDYSSRQDRVCGMLPVCVPEKDTIIL